MNGNSLCISFEPHPDSTYAWPYSNYDYGFVGAKEDKKEYTLLFTVLCTSFKIEKIWES